MIFIVWEAYGRENTFSRLRLQILPRRVPRTIFPDFCRFGLPVGVAGVGLKSHLFHQTIIDSVSVAHCDNFKFFSDDAADPIFMVF